MKIVDKLVEQLETSSYEHDKYVYLIVSEVLEFSGCAGMNWETLKKDDEVLFDNMYDEFIERLVDNGDLGRNYRDTLEWTREDNKKLIEEFLTEHA